MKKTKLFIEAVPLVDRQIGGIPHALAGLVAALAANQDVQKKFEIVLVAPGNRMRLLDRWKGLESCTRKPIPMKFRIMNGLGRRGLLPPMDLLLGRGVYLFGNFFNWPLTKRSKSLTYIHDVCFAVYPQYVQPDNQKSLAKNVPRYIKQTDYVITVSKSAKQEIAKYFEVKNDRILVVYNGADANLYKKYPEEEIKKVTKKYKLGGKKYFLYIGNIEPRKNLEGLLKAIAKLPKEYALIMVGSDGWLNQEVFNLVDAANESGHLVVKPRTYVSDDDLAKLLSGAEALVLPSFYEGFGMPALEALTAGTPAIVSDILSLREVVGQAGILCNPEDVDSIANAMKKSTEMSKAQKDALITRGKKQSKEFSWQASADGLAKILLKIEKTM
ncbi:MAG: glycosyltransferase family 1 protein [Candidatus Woesebacteria bacterium]|jgi:glycosyltransferase involved in cell wall biosynthesis